MKLSAPKQGTWGLSLLLGLLAILNRYGQLGIPLVSGREFLLLTVGFIILLLGTMMTDF